MSTTYCPSLSGDPAIAFTSGGYQTFMQLAPRAFEEAQRQAQQLNTVLIKPVQFDVDFHVPEGLAEYRRPTRPAIDLSAFQFKTPPEAPAPPSFSANTPTITAMPEADLTPPRLDFGDKPSSPIVAAPVPPPRRPELVMPTEPTFTMPVTPTFEQLNLPTVPSVLIPTFVDETPEFVEPHIDGNWSFNPEAYASTLKDKLVAKLGDWMDGKEALPPQIENALFARGRARIEVETRRAIDARVDEFGARGFSEPQGSLAGAITDILQEGQNKRAELGRDVTLKSFDEALQNMRLAVQQGIALEQVATNLHIEEQRLILTGLQFQRETTIAILNARISIFNARLEGAKTKAAVFEQRIRAELAKVEVYRAQIEGEKARGEINEQRVRAYVAQIQSVNALVDLYRSRVDAVKVQAEANQSEIETYKAEVQAYGIRWDAFAKEYDAYKSSIEAENSKVTVHRNLVDAFGQRIQAWQTQNNLQFDRERLRIAEHGQNLQAWRGLLDKQLALIQGETARIQGVAAGSGAIAQLYQADAAVETAASAAQDRTLQIALQREESRTQLELKQAEIRVQENIQLTQLLLEVRKTLAQVASQLSASAFSAMNFSANVSSSMSQSRSCSTSYSWSGEAPDLS
ncbi:MAG TPA: hypothetical protein VFE72_08870 [Lysobacter sp.]|nr:hypothetical protein [Lysobacter sp.]